MKLKKITILLIFIMNDKIYVIIKMLKNILDALYNLIVGNISGYMYHLDTIEMILTIL